MSCYAFIERLFAIFLLLGKPFQNRTPDSQSKKMPFVQISSNVARAAVALTPAMQSISKALAGALSKPEAVVMVHLNLDQPMLFAASDAVRRSLHVLSSSSQLWHCMRASLRDWCVCG